MAIISKFTSAAEAHRLASASYLDDAAAPQPVSYDAGFAPRYITVVNATDRITLEWYEGMASGAAIKTLATGVRTLETTGGVTVSGSRIGFAPLQSKQYHFQVAG